MAWLAAVLAPVLLLVVAAWLRRWTTDDAFINYRVIDQIKAGNGPVFNAGQRVETATSTLWLLLLLVGDLLLPLRIEYVAFVFSIPLAGLGLAAMSIGARHLLTPCPEDEHDAAASPPGRRRARLWLPAGTLLLVALPPVWDFSTSGLETGLVLAWTGLLTLGLGRASEDSCPRWLFLVAGLGPLVRPDCAIPAVAVLVFVVITTWRRDGVTVALKNMALAAAIPAAYQVFRMAYFAALVPNTALAKGADQPHWTEGWAYVTDFFGAYVLYLPLAALFLAALLVAVPLPGRRRTALAVLPVGGLLQALFIVRAGGDYMHARLLLPPLFALVAPVAVLPVPLPGSIWAPAPRGARRPPLASTATLLAVSSLALMGWAAVSTTSLRDRAPTNVGRSIIGDGRQAIVGFLHMRNPVTAEDFGWGSGSARARAVSSAPVSIGEQILDVAPAPGLHTPAVALYGIGVTGYSLDTQVYVLDLLGLGDPFTARLKVSHPGFVGHEKPLPEPWAAARLSRNGLGDFRLTSGFAVPLYVSPPGRLAADTDTARRALRCRPLQRLRAATEDPLTVRRALSNVRRSFELSTLRVDPDPARALEELC
jgi:arabinofuranosyltransferase